MTSSYVFMKLTTFFVGLGFFGDPIIQRGVAYLNRRFPKWQKLIELQKCGFSIMHKFKILIIT